MTTTSTPPSTLVRTLTVDDRTYSYVSLRALQDDRVTRLPYSIRVLLESALRNQNGFSIRTTDVQHILEWAQRCGASASASAGNNESDDASGNGAVEIPFKPARVLMQDFTGVPAVVDLAAMRDAMVRLGGDPSRINPLVPTDLVVDHSVQVDAARTPDAFRHNLQREMERNAERFRFLKWGSTSFRNFQIVPPGSGIVHQVNLEYLARVVFVDDSYSNATGGTAMLYPDSVVGTDSHTTMINGLGVVGWGVGGIEAEAVMLGQHISMVLPQVVGVHLTGAMPANATATDLVLTLTERLRQVGVVDKFVEFFGEGVHELTLADRATIANMAPEYGATIGFFPVDQRTLDYLVNTNRDAHKVRVIEAYLRAQDMFVEPKTAAASAGAAGAAGAPPALQFSSVLELDLGSIVPCVAGPKRPHDRVAVSAMQSEFRAALRAPVGFKGYGLSTEQALSRTATFTMNSGGGNDGKPTTYTLRHGSVVIAAITSCTNTSNPSVMLGAALLAKNAAQRGLRTLPYIKTSLAPGSGVVTKYLDASGLQPFLDLMGFALVGYGCTSCIGNSGDLAPEVAAAIETGDIVAAAVLSGNRNFEGRVHPLTRANYLASPPLVVAYAIAGTVDIDFETEPLGVSEVDGKPVFLRDVWPSPSEVQEVMSRCVVASMFSEVYRSITNGTDEWNRLVVDQSLRYAWDASSTYIHQPPYFDGMSHEPPETVRGVTRAYVLLNLGDSITTDHISPAGDIARNSPAARFLTDRSVGVKDFNTYGSRRGNDEIMARGTFANIRLVNKMAQKVGPFTVHVPTGELLPIYDAAARYMSEGHDLVILAGKDYGSGSSRDWAAKGPKLQGVRAVIAVSFERIHRSNLVGMGILPLVFLPGQSADTLGLTGHERVTIELPTPLRTQQVLTVRVERADGATQEFQVRSRLDTEAELEFFRHDGVLPFVVRKLVRDSTGAGAAAKTAEAAANVANATAAAN